MKDTNSLSHTSYRCKYHVVMVPKYRRVVIYNKLRADIIEIIKILVNRKPDLKIIEAKDLYVSQSTLTGESEASKKVVNLENNKIETITDLNNVCFMGTNVTSGYAKAVVIKTGDNTYFGKIAHTVTNGKPQTAFQKGRPIF